MISIFQRLSILVILAGCHMTDSTTKDHATVENRSILQRIKYYRDMGFFSDMKGKSDEEAMVELDQRYRNDWAQPLTSILQNPLCDILLLKYDASRVWWCDLEADVCPDNNVYIKTLQEWGIISRGSFAPRNIQETWDTVERDSINESETLKVRNITISFILNDQRKTIYPNYEDDYIDLSVILQINELIKSTGYQFEPYGAFDQSSFIVVLTKNEKRKLREERGWKFAIQD